MNLLALTLVVFAAAPSNDTQANALIEKLGDDDFDVRQDAEKHLKNWGGKGYKSLHKHRDSSDLEIRNRLSKLLAAIEVPMFEKQCAEYKKYSVLVSHKDDNGIRGQMTGLLIKSTKTKTYVLTCWFNGYYHNEATVHVDHNGKSHKGKLIKKDEGTQMALLSYDKGGVPCVEFSDKKPSGYICHWGNGDRGEPKLATGTIKRTEDKIEYQIHAEYGDAGSGVYFFKEGKLYLTAMIWGQGLCADVQEADAVKDFLKDVEWE